MIFGLAAPAIDILVERAGVAFAQIGDDETGVGSFRANFDAGDDPLDAAPAFRAVEELLETANLAVPWRGAEDVIEAVGPTPVEDLWAAIMAVGAQQDLGVGPVGADRAQQAA